MGALAPRALLLLTLGVQGPFGLTLCVAADGHAMLELAHGAAPCAGEIRRHHPEVEILAENEFARHPCRDVPMLERASYRTADAAPFPAPSLIVLACPVADTGSAQAPLAGRLTAIGPPQMTTRFIRSVILLA